MLQDEVADPFQKPHILSLVHGQNTSAVHHFQTRKRKVTNAPSLPGLSVFFDGISGELERVYFKKNRIFLFRPLDFF